METTKNKTSSLPADTNESKHEAIDIVEFETLDQYKLYFAGVVRFAMGCSKFKGGELSVAELARKSNLPVEHVQNIMDFKISPSHVTRKKILEALGLL